ncbi:DUF6526 family protein [Paenibacillus sacheonensis]|uniref:Uncharacterized protein n=1 Tax=Paenibacillus sacheonensis TaxID=742054 RepID=A0A7X4YSQ2_9BACL|nr:DUF6526 family protein [Paenibacillus sacheonensis]MBM7568152.1 hypothetical protein [Paenibacillus sacheonensis]NBC71846.1 hypothetical protein [Paenibacillus sacheonensis]
MTKQNYQNHVRMHPLFHYVGAPLILVSFLGAIVFLCSERTWFSLLFLVCTAGILITFLLVRSYATKLQDRIIRTEENFRHFVLTGAPLDPQLTGSQIIALRFASDQEFPNLCRLAVQQKLTSVQIKQAVQDWKNDEHRV